MCVSVCVHVCESMCVHVCVHVCESVCVHVCVCECMSNCVSLAYMDGDKFSKILRSKLRLKLIDPSIFQNL